MSESPIADFVARFHADSRVESDPVLGRVVLSQKRLVLATGEGRTTIPLHDVFDVVVGHVPVGLSEFFDDAVALAYRRGDDRVTAVVEADDETITRFRTVLFKALLRDATVHVRHPRRVGGRVIDTSSQAASLHVGERSVRFSNVEPPLRIDLSAVTHFKKTDRTVNGHVRPALEVEFTRDGRVMTTEIVLESQRLMNLLGRYLRLEYSELASEVRDMDLSEVEIALLTALYSGAGQEGLSGVLGLDPGSVTMLLNALEEKRLLSSTTDGTRITPLGRFAVSDRVESVNA